MNVLGLILLLGIGLAIGWAATVLYTVWLLRHPPRRTYAFAVSRQLPGDPSEIAVGGGGPAARIEFSSWSFNFRGQNLPVWDVPGAANSASTLVITHGWGDSRISMLDRLPHLLPHFRRIILWDMPGHGEAPGICTLGTREPAALSQLLAQLGPAYPVVLYGFSLGAGVSIHAATDAAHIPNTPRIAAVIAEAPYRLPWTPARNVLRLRALPYRTTLPPAIFLAGVLGGAGVRWWPRRGAAATAGGFDRALLAAKLSIPLLVIHAVDDAISPIVDGRAIAAAAGKGQIAEIPGASHQDVWMRDDSRALAVRAIKGLLAKESTK